MSSSSGSISLGFSTLNEDCLLEKGVVKQEESLGFSTQSCDPKELLVLMVDGRDPPLPLEENDIECSCGNWPWHGWYVWCLQWELVSSDPAVEDSEIYSNTCNNMFLILVVE